MLDHEALFQMLVKKEWNELAKVMHYHAKQLETDQILRQVVSLFEAEFLTSIGSLEPQDWLKASDYTSLNIDLNTHAFSPEFVGRFIDEKLRVLRVANSECLLSYANSHQKRPLAREILKVLETTQPEKLADARRQHVSIKATNTGNGKVKIINLFKSQQEQNFFEAIREAFPTYHPYPNVALSCILDFDAIKTQLTHAESEYFTRAIIDCVVFDTRDGYEPKFFFELDSVYHDSRKASHNDQKKDAIFEAANAKLIRIRAQHSSETTVQQFKQLVLEIMR